MKALEKVDIAIIGASYMGLTTALMLANLGLKIAVLERRPLTLQIPASQPARLLAIASKSCDIFSDHGIEGLFKQDVHPINFIRVMEEETCSVLDFNPAEVGLSNFGIMIAENVLLNRLYERVKANDLISLHYDIKLQEVEINPLVNIITSKLDLRARLLLGCDGKNSWVRKYFGIEVQNFDYKQYAIIADIAHSLPHEGAAIEKFLPEGPFAILPQAGGYTSSIVWTVPSSIAARLKELNEAALAQLIYEKFGDYLGALEIKSSLGFYPLSLVHAKTYISKRMALLGDAAHSIHPLAGQGLNLGLRDAEEMVQQIKEYQQLGMDIGCNSLLKNYNSKRLFDNNLMIEATHGINTLFSNNIVPIKALRGWGLNLVNRSPFLKGAFMRYAIGD